MPIFVCGAECGLTTAQPGHIDVITGAAASLETTTIEPGGGTRSYKWVATGAQQYFARTLAQTTIAGRIYFNFAAFPNVTEVFIAFINTSGSALVKMTAGGQLRIRMGGSAADISVGSALTLNTWHLLDLSVDCSSGTAVLTASLDGGASANDSHVQVSSNLTQFRHGFSSGGATSGTVFVDQMELDVIGSYPIGAGAVTGTTYSNETVGGAATVSVTAADTAATISDALARTGTFVRGHNDDLLDGVDELAIRAAGWTRGAADSVATAAEALGVLVGRVCSVADSLASATEAAVRGAVSYTRGTTEDPLAPISEAAGRPATYSRTLTDAVSSLGTGAVRVATWLRTAADSVATATEAVVRAPAAKVRTTSASVATLTDRPSGALTSGSGPTFSNLADYSSATVAMYAQYEASWDLSGDPYANPYDPAVIAVDATFTSPTGRQLRRPCFWFQDYTVAAISQNETYTPSGSPHWHVRFMPDEVGAWTYTITAVSTLGSTTTAPRTVTATAAAKHGPLHANGLALAYADGTAFNPVGNNQAFDDEYVVYGVAGYSHYLGEMAAAACNVARFWMWPHNRSGLEWTATATLYRTPNPYSGLGTYSQVGAYRTDRFIQIAEGLNIVTQLTFDNYGDFRNEAGNGMWLSSQTGGPNPYSSEVGGPIPSTNPEQTWTNATARTYFKRRYRYIAARWGGYWNLIYELWNEAGSVGQVSYDAFDPTNGATDRAAMATWASDMTSYLRSNDAAKHPITWSHEWPPDGGPGPHVAGDGHFDAIWTLPNIDIVQGHNYRSNDNIVSSGWKIYQIVEDAQARLGKPYWIGEAGLSVSNPVENDFDPTTSGLTTFQKDHLTQGTHVHNMLWMAAVEGSTAMYWWWGGYLYEDAGRHRGAPAWPQQPNHHAKLALFMAGEDQAALASPKALAPSANVIAYGKGSSTHALLYVRDLVNTYDSGADCGDLAGRTISGATVAVPGMVAGVAFTVQVWNPWTGAQITTLTPTSNGSGTLTIALPDFQRDLAFKVNYTSNILARTAADAIAAISVAVARGATAFARSHTSTIATLSEAAAGVKVGTHDFVVTAADAIASAGEALLSRVGVVRPVADDVTPITEGTSRDAYAWVRTNADAVATATEAASRAAAALLRDHADAVVSVAEAIPGRLLALGRPLAEAVGAITTDAATGSQAYVRQAADAVANLTASVVRGATAFGRTASDIALPLTEALGRQASWLRTAAATLGALAEAVLGGAPAGRPGKFKISDAPAVTVTLRDSAAGHTGTSDATQSTVTTEDD